MSRPFYRILPALVLAGLTASGVLASQDAPALRLPAGFEQGYGSVVAVERVRLPVGPFADGTVPGIPVTGRIERQVWTSPPGLTETLRIMAPLRAQLEQQGYTVLFECETRECGGFDFRFQTDVVDEPEMHVDLGDYRFLSARRGEGDQARYVSLLVSRSAEKGFVQITTIGPPRDEAPPPPSLSSRQVQTVTGLVGDTALIDELVNAGKAVLDGLRFVRGSAELSGDPATSLQELAAWLRADPGRHVVLVGHTDAVGSLDGNLKLSQKRADAVMRRLIEDYRVNPEQVSAEGVGYLAPRAPNTTEEGRARNRRVEVILLAGE